MAEYKILTEHTFTVCDYTDNHHGMIKNIDQNTSVTTIYKHGDIRDVEIRITSTLPTPVIRYISYETCILLEQWKGSQFLQKFLSPKFSIFKAAPGDIQYYLRSINLPTPDVIKIPYLTALNYSCLHTKNNDIPDMFLYKCNSRKTFALLNSFILTCKQYLQFIVKKDQSSHVPKPDYKKLTTLQLLIICTTDNIDMAKKVDSLYKQNYNLQDAIQHIQTTKFKHMLKLIHPNTKYYDEYV